MMKHVNLQDVVDANNLIVSMGGEDQLPTIASAAIERSLELQHRVDRAIRYAEEAHSSSLHVKQVLRILDGSITLDDENNEVPEKEYPHLVQRAAHEQQSLPPATLPPIPQQGPSGLAGRSTEQRKVFRQWLSGQGIELPLNMAVPQEYVDAFDKATDGRYKPIPKRTYRQAYTGTRGKLKPGHGLDGRSQKERLHLREWLAEQGFDINPTGRIPQKHIDHYDAAMAELQRMRREQRQPQEQEREQEAQGA